MNFSIPLIWCLANPQAKKLTCSNLLQKGKKKACPLSFYHTIQALKNQETESFRKHCGKGYNAGNQHFLNFSKRFLRANVQFQVTFFLCKQFSLHIDKYLFLLLSTELRTSYYYKHVLYLDIGLTRSNIESDFLKELETLLENEKMKVMSNVYNRKKKLCFVLENAAAFYVLQYQSQEY